MKLASKPLAALTMALAICGCALSEQSRVQVIGYQQTGAERTIDPATGDVLLISRWRYDDGYTTETYKRIKQGNEERQSDRPPPPETRVTD